ncbi:MAG: hypothetical protein WCD04_05285 [Terriglobia bacterium]
MAAAGAAREWHTRPPPRLSGRPFSSLYGCASGSAAILAALAGKMPALLGD